MTRTDIDWISAAEAARLLRITRPTLYAYVSRGFVRSQAAVGPTRARRYAREDVERLRRRAEERRDPAKVATHAMQWGLPVLESALTLIADGRLYYRGHDAIALARERSLAEVASLIWTGDFDASFAGHAAHGPRAAHARRPRAIGCAMPFTARAQTLLAHASAADDSAFDLRPVAVTRAGWDIVRLLALAAPSRGQATRAARSSDSRRIDEQLVRQFGVTSTARDVIRAALILCADHELNVSAFTARCVASAGASPYAVVAGGLAALEGVRHGGATRRMESLLAAVRHARDRRAALAARLRERGRLEGFGHPLYPDGDTRAVALLAMLREHHAKSRELDFVRAVAEAGARLTHERPNLDFALAAAARVLRLPSDSGIALFAIGRTIGWIGHAIEQYATDQLIRPRAKYVGVVPVA